MGSGKALYSVDNRRTRLSDLNISSILESIKIGDEVYAKKPKMSAGEDEYMK